MLRLVHPAPEGQEGTRPSRRRRVPCASLTVDEKRHLRTALHNLRRAYGTWSCVADAMGVREKSIEHAARARNPQGSPGMAIRAARAGGMSVEAVLSGAITSADRCEACGSRVMVGTARAAGGAS